MDNRGIKVRIFDIENGLREYEDIKIIRIISKDYNLLIMKDYLPIIGEIEGSVDIKNDEINLSFKDIKAISADAKYAFNAINTINTIICIIYFYPFYFKASLHL